MTLLIEDKDVPRLLPMKDCVEAMEWAFREFASGVAVSPPRLRYESSTPVPDVAYGTNIHAGTVPHYGTAALLSGSTAYTELVNAEGQTTGTMEVGQRNWSLVLLYSLETGELLAIIQARTLSDIRVPATTAVAVKYLARDQVDTLGLLGTGKLAQWHIPAVSAVRPIKKVLVYSPNEEHRTRFCKEMSEATGLDVQPQRNAKAVVDGADLLCCATNAITAVFEGEWLRPGQLVTTVVNTDRHRLKGEADQATIVRADPIVINDKESVFSSQQVELLRPIEEGLFGWDKVHELGDIVAGKVPGRTNENQLIYYKSNTGMGMQRAAAGAVIYREAKRQGIGRELPTEWFFTDMSDYYDSGYSLKPI